VREEPWTIAVGADNAGYALKEHLRGILLADARVKSVIDVGVMSADDGTPYPHVGIAAAEAVRDGRVERALLVCGTGIGVAIAANKVAGVRATVAHDAYSVERSVLSNNAQVLCFGARVIGPELAAKLVGEWLSHEFDQQSSSAAKVSVIEKYEAC
jgi:ribose 5-phosphate isomerase B